MAIYYYNGENYKKYSSLKKLIISKHINSVVDQLQLEKELANGNNIYCCIDPYYEEINNIIELMWHKDKKTLEINEANAAEDI